jgi:uncharacterized RDD family membrane protein YckC
VTDQASSQPSVAGASVPSAADAVAPGAASGDLRYADVPNRLVAYLVDAIILAVIVFIGALVVSALFGPAVRFDLTADTPGGRIDVDDRLAIVNALVGTALGGAYFVGSWMVLRASPAQRLFGMEIGHERDGATLTLGVAVLRWILLGAPFGIATALTTGLAGFGGLLLLAALLWYLILLVTTARSSTRQGLHDRLARTVVAKPAHAAVWGDRPRQERARVR